MNRLISFLDLPFEAQDVLLQRLNDSLQLHLLSLQALDVIGSLFNLLLQAAELKIQMAATKTSMALSCLHSSQLSVNVKSSPSDLGTVWNFPGQAKDVAFCLIRSSSIPLCEDGLSSLGGSGDQPPRVDPEFSKTTPALKGWNPCLIGVTKIGP